MVNPTHPPHALPRFVQISEFLMREIASGQLIDGERLAPEREMAAEFNVSVGTLRKSLNQLEKKGLLERVQGSGNYVRQGDAVDSVYAMFRLELRQGGGLPRADVLDVTLLRKPDDLPKFGTSTEASRIRRLRYLNDTIVAVEEIWLDHGAGIVTADALSESLYHYYRTKLDLWIARAEDYVSIDAVPNWSPALFPIPPGTVTGFIERFSWADGPNPVEFSRTWFDTSQAHYVQRLK
ncbi:MAG: GntR family transcriptional regulator [Sulfitobacter sp.]